MNIKIADSTFLKQSLCTKPQDYALKCKFEGLLMYCIISVQCITGLLQEKRRLF